MASRGLMRCVLAAVLFGCSTPATSRLTDEMGTFALAGLLYLGAALAVLPFATRTLPSSAVLRRTGWRLSTAVVLGGIVGPVLLVAGLTHVPASTGSLLLNLELVFTVLLAATLFREHLGPRVRTGAAVVVAGGAILGWSGTPELRWGAVFDRGRLPVLGGGQLCDRRARRADSRGHHPRQRCRCRRRRHGYRHGAERAAERRVRGRGPRRGALGYGASISLWVSGARDLGVARAQLVFATAPSSAPSGPGRCWTSP